MEQDPLGLVLSNGLRLLSFQIRLADESTLSVEHHLPSADGSGLLALGLAEGAVRVSVR